MNTQTVSTYLDELASYMQRPVQIAAIEAVRGFVATISAARHVTGAECMETRTPIVAALQESVDVPYVVCYGLELAVEDARRNAASYDRASAAFEKRLAETVRHAAGVAAEVATGSISDAVRDPAYARGYAAAKARIS